MKYSVKEIFLSVQGEGAQTGRPSVFVRFAGCNLWSGREKDRASAVCKFCDTEFVGTDGVGGGVFTTPEDLANEAMSYWPKRDGKPIGEPWVICTGGEPLLQLDAHLIAALHGAGFNIAVETNGTIEAPGGIDWLCVSPKANAELLQRSGDELKLVYPQKENSPPDFAELDFKRFSLQPLDDQRGDQHRQAAFEYCMQNPQWRLSLQTHKWLGVR
ncbi:MAG: 7-carboxy-7-deazaguanine synthase [Acidimicrobiales bacterium]|nr:MAG: 7-carboxy-7-deazaguanine synthase [Acidimicrobiales bacterium]